MIKENDNKNYSISKYHNDIFKWKIEMNGKYPLIMDFSKPPNYDLSVITYIENKNINLIDYVERIFYINLNEKIIDICDKIEQFLEDIYKTNKRVGINHDLCLVC